MDSDTPILKECDHTSNKKRLASTLETDEKDSKKTKNDIPDDSTKQKTSTLESDESTKQKTSTLESDDSTKQKTSTLESDDSTKQKTSTLESDDSTKQKTSTLDSTKRDMYNEFNDEQKKCFNNFIESTAEFIQEAVELYLAQEDNEYEEEHSVFYSNDKNPVGWLQYFYCPDSLTRKTKYEYAMDEVLEKSNTNQLGNGYSSRRDKFVKIMGKFLDDYEEFDSLNLEYTKLKLQDDEYKHSMLEMFWSFYLNKSKEFDLDTAMDCLRNYEEKDVSTMVVISRFRSYGGYDEAPCCARMQEEGYCNGHDF